MSDFPSYFLVLLCCLPRVFLFVRTGARDWIPAIATSDKAENNIQTNSRRRRLPCARPHPCRSLAPRLVYE